MKGRCKEIVTSRKQVVAALLGVFLISSCASIPKESPGLSQEIGKRIAKMEEAHLNLVHKYFDLKRAEVDRIFEEEWIPAYAESFFSQDQVANYWDSLVSGDDSEERLDFLTRLGPRMLEEIRQKRAEFMEPLNELEAQIEDSLKNEYRKMLAANNSLTSFLANASEVDENRDRYLEMFGIEESEVEDYVNRIDRQSEQIMETIKKANL